MRICVAWHPEAGKHGYKFEPKENEPLKHFDYVLSAAQQPKEDNKNGDIFSIGARLGRISVAWCALICP